MITDYPNLNAIKNNQDPTEFIKKYNKRATEAENLVNQYKSRNTKKVYFPKITKLLPFTELQILYPVNLETKILNGLNKI